MCFPSPLSLEKSFFEGVLLISGIKFMQSTIHIISVIVYVCVCVSLWVCLCLCVGRCMDHPCHLHVREWRIWMLLPSQESLIHLSTKKRYTHIYEHTHTHTGTLTDEA